MLAKIEMFDKNEDQVYKAGVYYHSNEKIQAILDDDERIVGVTAWQGADKTLKDF